MACQHCGAVLKVALAMAGKQGKCPKCRKLTTIAPPVMSPPTRHAASKPKLDAGEQLTPVIEPLASLPRDERARRIMAAFRGPIKPVERSESYRRGVMMAALVMLLLPPLYVLIISGLAGLLCGHAAYNTWLLTSGGAPKTVSFYYFLYFAPLFVGGVIILFMLKPLFARIPSKQSTRSISRQEEPLLFAFVDKVCDSVQAPRPTRIDIDCDVNASAGFRRGFLSFFGDDLVLTLGLPLTAGLTLTEFGGVLAHEFGHFSQGAAMRVSFVMRSISHWFARAIGERDVFDVWLEGLANTFGVRLGFIFYLAMGGVWLSRLVLSTLLHFAFLVIGVLMREMEFDADLSEIRFGGSNSFIRTTRKMRLLGLAFHVAVSDAARFAQEGRLADNLVRLTLASIPRIPTDIKQKALEEADKEETDRFDSHPCDRERIARAQEENAPGIFSYEEPASALFTDFEAISRLATCDYYTDVIGIALREGLLHPVEKLLGIQAKDDDSEKALARVIGNNPVFRVIDMPAVAPQIPFEQQYHFILQAREFLLSTRDAYFKEQAAFVETRDQILDTQVRHALINANAARSALTDEGPRDANAVMVKLHTEGEKLNRHEAALMTFENCAGQRIAAALSICASGRFEDESHPFSDLDLEINRWVSAKRQLDAMRHFRVKLELAVIRYNALFVNLESSANRPGYVDTVLSTSREVGTMLYEIRQRTTDVYYPFEHTDPNMTLARYFWDDPLPQVEEVAQMFEAGMSTVDRFIELSNRLTARLALVAEQIETALGLPAFPEPPPAPVKVETSESKKK